MNVYRSAVAFLDMGLLFIANLIMRTRLPAKRKQAGGSSLWKTVLTDVPYLVFVLGVFLVRRRVPSDTPCALIIPDIDFLGRLCTM